MEKIHITVCAGTMCHVMGGGHLYDLLDELPPEWRDRVEVEGQRCLGYCEQKNQAGGAPYVLINGEVLANASLSAVMERLRKLIEGDAEDGKEARHAAR